MQITKTSPNRPPRMIIYGEHKVGKSTFAASTPRPIFIQCEDGLDALGVDAFPLATSFRDVLAAIQYLVTETHDYKTLVVDSLDWLEKLIWQAVCEKKGVSNIGEAAYGTGYKEALVYWAEFTNALNILRASKKMIILLIAHAKISRFEDPTRDSYDRFDLNLHDKAGNMMCEWVDVIGFAAIQAVVVKNKEGFSESTKIRSTDKRVLNLCKNAAFEAGNRYNLPAQMPLEWQPLADKIKEHLTTVRVANENKAAAASVAGTDPLPAAKTDV